jgi:tRNA (adenine37-N6)-methyltransferase
MIAPVTFTPIGVARTPFADRVSAPRQPYAGEGVEGTIELFPGRDFEHALSDLEGWDRIWVIFCFHLNEPGVFRPKVLPPRSPDKRRGLFATRSPHRPNPIGLSVVRLVSVEGLVLRVRDLDLVDGSPVLDIKPYVPYADAFPDARTGWLAPLDSGGSSGERPRDPEPGFSVRWSDRANAQAAWLDERGVNLRTPVDRALSLGPQPHPYRRIKREGDHLRLAVKDWRVRFRVEGRDVTVLEIASGYRAKELATSPAPEVALQRAFVARFEGAP